MSTHVRPSIYSYSSLTQSMAAMLICKRGNRLDMNEQILSGTYSFSNQETMNKICGKYEHQQHPPPQ